LEDAAKPTFGRQIELEQAAVPTYPIAMLTTLKATVQGDRIRWLEKSENAFPPTRLVQALITPLEEPPAAASPDERSRRRVTALKKLAALNAFSDIPDPVAWQRAARSDRELPAREP
jgi:hypothetical protein